MTIQELYEEQGFIVIAYDRDSVSEYTRDVKRGYLDGSKIKGPEGPLSPGCRVRIVSIATRQDWVSQCKLRNEIPAPEGVDFAYLKVLSE